MTPERIEQGVQFWLDHRQALEQFAAQYQVPPEYLVAIIGMETKYGRVTGGYRVLDALMTLRRSTWPLRSKHCQREARGSSSCWRASNTARSPRTVAGSLRGSAMGVPQFMPSAYRRYAVDADGRCPASITVE